VRPARLQHQLVLPDRTFGRSRCRGAQSLLLVYDLSLVAERLAAGELGCPHRGCDGLLGPWGHARTRRIRMGSGRTLEHRPRRARCRSCGRTQVLLWVVSHPRRADAAEVVGAALTAAAGGAGYRAIAEQLAVPPSTVRDWLQRAKANSEIVRADATVAFYALDANAGAIAPQGSPLADMVEAVGQAVAAAVRRLGPVPSPWQLAVTITRAAILAPRPARSWGAR
jgi:transposase-like protein